MDDPLHNEEKIISYLDGVMNSAEKKEFEQQLQQDPGLREQLESLQIATEAVKQYGTQQKVGALHKEMMRELLNEKQPAKVVPFKRVIRYSMAVAASILLVVIGIQTYFYFQPSSGKLYNDAYVEYNVSSVRGSGDKTTTIESFYKAGNYAEVIRAADGKVLTQRDSFITALSYLKTENLPLAIDWFNRLSSNSSYRQDAEFYLSLAYLKNKNYDKSLEQMQKIHADANHPYHANISEELIEKVKKLK